MKSQQLILILSGVLMGIALGVIGDRTLTARKTPGALDQNPPVSPNSPLPVGFNRFKAELIDFSFDYPASWGAPQEDLTVREGKKQYIISFAKAPTVFAGSMTDGFTGFDRNIIEIAVSRAEKRGKTLELYLGSVRQYYIENIKVIKNIHQGEVILGDAPPPGIAGFEGGDRVGIIPLGKGEFQVLVFHFHKIATEQEIQSLLESVEVR